MKPLTQEQFEAIKQWMADDKSVDAIVLMNFIDRFQPQPEQPTLLNFNIEEALKNPDRVVYRDGSKPLEWHLFEKVSGLYPITSVATNELCVIHTKDGNQVDDENNTPKDLFLLPEPKKEYFINVYDVNGVVYASKPFNSAEQAGSEMEFPLKFLKTISFTI